MSKKKDNKSIIERIVNIHYKKLNIAELKIIIVAYEDHVINNKSLSGEQKDIILKINREIAEGNR